MSSPSKAELEVEELARRYSVSIARVGRTLVFLAAVAVAAGALTAAEPIWPKPMVIRAMAGLAGIAALGACALMLVLLRARAKLRRISG